VHADAAAPDYHGSRAIRRGAGCRGRGGVWHPADADEPGGSSKLYRHLWDAPRCKPPSPSSLDAALRAQVRSPPPAPEHGCAHRGEQGRRGEANKGGKWDDAARRARAGELRGRPVVRRGAEPRSWPVALLLAWEGIDLQLCFHRWLVEHGQEQR
jgi:hypothetical protein